MKRSRKKKKLNTLDKILIVLSVAIFSFVVATMIIYTVKDWQFDTLIQCFLGAGGLESFIMGSIQIAKYFKRKGDDKNDAGNDDEDN